MYCASCGTKVEEAFNYCSSCGTKVENYQKKRERSVEASEGSSQSTSHGHGTGSVLKQQTLQTFAQFAKAKSEERQSHFKPKKRSKQSVHVLHEVTLNIGLMEYALSELKPCRGASLPLKVPDNASYDDLLSAALKKRKAFDRRFRAERGYVIAYPDTSIARKIPGTEDEFVLKNYKEWLGKPYSRITLYLSPVTSTSEDEFDENMEDEITFNADDDNYGQNSLEDEENEGSVENVSSSDVLHGNISSYLTTDFIPLGITETEAVDEAIAMSLSEFQDTNETEVIDDFLQQTEDESAMQNTVIAHVEKVLTGDPRNIVVSRLRIWDTAKAYFKRRSFMSKTGLLKVTFATGLQEEDAIDHGGPRREFLHLLLGAICNDSNTLTSTSLGCVMRCNFRAMQNEDYRTIGQMLATIIIHGGEHPRIFSPAICSYITKGLEFCQPGIEEVPDPIVRDSLKKLAEAVDETSFNAVIAGCEWRYDVDGLPHTIPFQQRKVFIDEVAKYFTIIKCKGMLDGLLEGLKYYEVLDLVRSCDGLTKYLFQYNATYKIGAKEVLLLLKPMLSPVGHQRRPNEEIVLSKFVEFVRSVEDKTLLEILTDDIELTKEERDAIEKLTPGHILMFATGTPSAPVIGFNPKPSIKFVHDDAKLIPSAHTCGNVLYVYINQKTITGPLHYYMLTALMNGGVFSRI